MSIFNKIRDGLKKTRDSVSSMVGDVLSSFTKIDEDFFEELEETLILCDIGVSATGKIMDALRERVKADKITETAGVKKLLIDIIADMLSFDDTEISFPSVVLIVGVNGVGKTTSIGKLAKHYKNDGKKVYLAAADTFRAAAVEQLSEWGVRADVKVIKYGQGADPAAVVYDAIDSAKHNDVDLLICDTAGRLHNKKNLMNELEKINRVIDKSYSEADKKTYLVVDATTGQNAVVQAREFGEVTDLSGVILTKLDGTAKGGIVCAISGELNLPVVFVGVGEALDDLQPFDALAFAQSLLE
ncbi:MAG: signal recognition particle-docking protein FtsY [Clostridia bacterium]|jgi:fused signal recognition particle receptor|nr:signal recognition particle-docking protein FtsY [Clostridia bacterium]MBT7123186.1 signal recognition particle-docking protein FtsY [Clostridia bacterium]